MDRDLLSHLPVVLAVARSGSFAAAAARLGMGASAVSHAVKTVEDRIGMPLFARTTRSVALTEAGNDFLAGIEPALTAIEETIERVRAAKGKVTGVLRLNVPHVALSLAITPALAVMAQRHPDLTVEVVSDDRSVDIIAGGFDAGVRLGEMIAADMVAVRITPPFQAIMVASPEYLKTRGKPRKLADLQHHNCIGFRLLASGAAYAWDVKDGGKDVNIEVSGSARISDSVYAKELALAGIGIAYLFEPLARKEIRERKLIWLLPDASMDEPGLFLYFPRRASEMPKLRAFISVLKELTRSGTRFAGEI
ncbi:MAG TPA: LysR family transcriptional regulator [Rickettsiales bacterium]|nr:LysR family transcriptional regulator [Rickettsiales bacterium]